MMDIRPRDSTRVNALSYLHPKVHPKTQNNVIHLQEESNKESKVSKSEKVSGPPALIQPKEDSQDETSLSGNSFLELEMHESSRDEDLTTSKENNIANKIERIMKQKEVSTVMKATCKDCTRRQRR